jgi:hypothetical protein
MTLKGGLRLLAIGLVVVGVGSELLSISDNGLGPLQLGVISVGGILLLLSFLRMGALAQVGLAVVTVVLSLVGLEFALSFTAFAPAYHADMFTDEARLPSQPHLLCDEVLGCRVNAEYVRALTPCPYNERICSVNDMGYNDREAFIARDDNATPRLLLLGDSYTWGLSADVGQGWAELVEAVFEAEGGRVWNTGITASGTNQALAVAEYALPLLKPDIVVLGFYIGNDFRDNLYPIGSWLAFERDGKPIKLNRYVLDADLRPRLMSEQELFFASYNTRPPLNVLERVLRSTRLGTMTLNALDNLTRTRPSVDTRAITLEATRQPLARLLALVEGTGAKLLVLAIPSPTQLGRAGEDYQAFLTLEAELGLNVLHVGDRLTARDYAPFPDDHWNNDGHGKASQAVIACVRALLRDETCE